MAEQFAEFGALLGELVLHGAVPLLQTIQLTCRQIGLIKSKIAVIIEYHTYL